MDVKTLCLGVLTFGDATGYDIKKYFECTFSHFFVAGYGSIYPALAELSDQGLVTCRTETREHRPDRKIYHLTPAGQRAFAEALRHTPPRHKVRSEFMVLMYFAHLLPPERLDAVIDERLGELNHSIAAIRAYLEEADAGDECDERGRFCAGFGLAMATAARDYIRRYRHKVAGAPEGRRPGNVSEIDTPRRKQQ
ncbi:MAG: PadR family transcriptional regulator [Gammaproteobacteria bacterium]|jgi:DNA-binding PadR family transcriptional regulator